MKLLADVNVSALIVARLRSSGWDVTRVVDLMDPRTPDTEIVEVARERGAVLVSHDQDFSAQLAVAGARQPSLINLRTPSVEVDFPVRCIEGVPEIAREDLAAGAIVTVEDGGMRIRRLPIGCD